ncbi:phage major capsid protein [Mycobacterium sp. UM_Kg27]|uniref:phage major capsid protein n=1 Tax=Mycobacterium sp. UM_Kg27 TaxID=1545693 RepID=UPI000A4113FE|nr:phage major capsid protein [Mycobacterium sp. UM_Kg27]
MSTTRADLAAAWLPEDYGDLVNLAVQAKSIAANAATFLATNRAKLSVPVWKSDPGTGWYSELDVIAEADGEADEVTVIPTKTAGLTLVGNESVGDTDPAIADRIGQALANQIARSVDQAFFANTTAKGPNGLLSLSYSVVGTGGSLTNLDAFVSARYKALAHGSTLTAWVVSPETAETLSKLKIATGSNQPLLTFVDDGIQVCGLPVLVSDQVDSGTVAWGIPRDHVLFVQRTGTAVEQFHNVAQDGRWIRATSRIGFAFVNEPGVVRIVNGPITYTLSFGGATGGNATVGLNGLGPSVTIAHNANAAAVKSAIVGIDDGIVADDVTVTGSAGEFTVSVPGVLTVDGSALTGGTGASVTLA